MRITMMKYAAAMLMLPALANGAVPHLLKPIKPHGDSPVVIEWDSDPAAVYSVEYSVGTTGSWSRKNFPLKAQQRGGLIAVLPTSPLFVSLPPINPRLIAFIG